MSVLTESEMLRKAIERVAEDMIKVKANDCFRAYKCIVVSPADGSVMGVRKLGDTTVLFLPYSTMAQNAKPGDIVWVGTTNNNWLNAFVWHTQFFKDGNGGGSSTTFNLIPAKAALTSYNIDTTGYGTVTSLHGVYTADGEAQGSASVTTISDSFSLSAGQYRFTVAGMPANAPLVFGIYDSGNTLLFSTSSSGFTFTLYASATVHLGLYESGSTQYKFVFTPELFSA